MFPIDFLRSCTHQYVQVGLKNGEVYTGTLIECDTWMNLVLTSVTVTSPNHEEKKLEKAMIRGNSMKFMSMPREVVDIVKNKKTDSHRDRHTWQGRGRGGRGGGGRGGRGGRGRFNSGNNPK